MECVCTGCGRQYEYDKHSKKGHSKTRCNSCVVNCRRVEVIQKCVDYCGGKCVRCGYNKCKRALCFHHLDPNTKKFEISIAHCRSWESVREELDKCILVCANCHAEIHDEEASAPGHSQSEWVKRVFDKFYTHVCEWCGLEFNSYRNDAKFCSDKCSRLNTRKVDRPDLETLLKEIDETSYCAVGRKYGVSDNAIRKWIKEYRKAA